MRRSLARRKVGRMKKTTLKLKRDHHWKARPGHRIFVADRGELRFDIHDGWVIRLDPESVKIFDGDIGVGGNIQCLITFDFRERDAVRLIPAWDEVVRTLRLGHYVSDPATGRAIIPHLQ
jgi:hypothetical protein